MRIVKISALFALCLSFSGCNKSNQYGPVVEETYIHRYGVQVPVEDWQSRGQSGQVITTLKNGVVVTKNLSSGVLEGDTSYTFPHSDVIQKIETYSRGNLQKVMVNHYSGRPSHETLYTGENSRKITKWYENGAPQSKEEVVHGKLMSGEYYTSKNQLEAKISDGFGTRVQRDTYGQHLSNDTFVLGEMTLSTTFHPNGAPKDVTPYKNGVIDGELKTYLPIGEPNSVEIWVDGKKDGISVIYQNGEKFAEVPYVEGIKHGVERRYRDGDHLIEEIHWSNDQRHGPSYSYVGDVTKTDWYYQNRLVTEKTFDLLNRGKPL